MDVVYLLVFKMSAFYFRRFHLMLENTNMKNFEEVCNYQNYICKEGCQHFGKF